LLLQFVELLLHRSQLLLQKRDLGIGRAGRLRLCADVISAPIRLIAATVVVVALDMTYPLVIEDTKSSCVYRAAGSFQNVQGRGIAIDADFRLRKLARLRTIDDSQDRHRLLVVTVWLDISEQIAPSPCHLRSSVQQKSRWAESIDLQILLDACRISS
jgi:hypothetical protein